MSNKKIYIVAKVFDRPGCLAYLCKTANEARCLPGTFNFDEDAPELSPAMFKAFQCSVSQRNRRRKNA